jgi:transcription initiation factor IIE alpha subunit
VSAKAKDLAAQVTGLHASERLVLFVLALDADPRTGHRSRLTADQIRERTGLSTRSIRRALATLATLGHISREPAAAGGIHITAVHPDPGIAGHKKPSIEQSKRKISHRLARAVMERDAYRCVACGTHLDLGFSDSSSRRRWPPATRDHCSRSAKLDQRISDCPGFTRLNTTGRVP